MMIFIKLMNQLMHQINMTVLYNNIKIKLDNLLLKLNLNQLILQMSKNNNKLFLHKIQYLKIKVKFQVKTPKVKSINLQIINTKIFQMIMIMN